MTTNNDKKTILVVDDDVETRETYAELLRNNNFEVIEANDGVEGLDIATSKEGIDIIFTGIVMPRMDGFQLVKALKENTVTANIPVIINSHLGREADRVQAKELGVLDFIVRGTTTPVETIRRIIKITNQQANYLLKIDQLGLDGQKFIDEMRLPVQLKCDNCGDEIALKVFVEAGMDNYSCGMICSNCKKKY